ncbi:hypothetical protein NHX12_003773 [Muraenolepis orangiensis]|uniref:Uncharacterized protein n=1 Tax=Muraenolepis orangiensis TaxID=630683 RepID=A0A9Q0DVI8_9TELE|nr:hypothetical protein NHX12_003773 [Muraenolepis orangiensis]
MHQHTFGDGNIRTKSVKYVLKAGGEEGEEGEEGGEGEEGEEGGEGEEGEEGEEGGEGEEGEEGGEGEGEEGGGRGWGGACSVAGSINAIGNRPALISAGICHPVRRRQQILKGVVTTEQKEPECDFHRSFRIVKRR